MTNDISRRALIAGGVAAALPFTARSYQRIVGANDRIQIGELGVGHRAQGHRAMLKKSMETDPNFDVRSVCDLWSVNRERAAADVERRFGAKPKTFKYSEEMLADKELDAVMIATGDHQHARILAEVVRAGKDCYCEKPMANTLEDAKLARDTVKSSKQVVQMGSQWLSDPYQQRVREIAQSGKLGKIVSVSQSWNFNGPRWDVPKSPDIAALREQDTDWKRWLLGRPARPFDPRVYFVVRIF
jgi:predicted dehydrogenase